MLAQLAVLVLRDVLVLRLLRRFHREARFPLFSLMAPQLQLQSAEKETYHHLQDGASAKSMRKATRTFGKAFKVMLSIAASPYFL